MPGERRTNKAGGRRLLLHARAPLRHAVARWLFGWTGWRAACRAACPAIAFRRAAPLPAARTSLPCAGTNRMLPFTSAPGAFFFHYGYHAVTTSIPCWDADASRAGFPFFTTEGFTPAGGIYIMPALLYAARALLRGARRNPQTNGAMWRRAVHLLSPNTLNVGPDAFPAYLSEG